MKASMFNIGGVVAMAAFAALAAGCNSSSSTAPPAAANASAPSGVSAGSPSAHQVALTSSDAAPSPSSTQSAPRARPAPELHPLVVIETSLGPVTVKLHADKAPQTVANFLEYAARDFYTRTIVHYVQKDFIISAGGYTAEGELKPTRAEIRNEADNGLKNVRGTVAMARHPDYVHSATSQFFFNVIDNPGLDHRGAADEEYGYCVFGEVVKGMDVLDRLAQVEVQDEGDFVNRPVETVMIESVRRIR